MKKTAIILFALVFAANCFADVVAHYKLDDANKTNKITNSVGSDANFITAAPYYKAVYSVALAGGDFNNIQTAVNTGANTVPTGSERVLVNIAAGTYNYNTNDINYVQLRSYVDVNGSGWDTIINGRAGKRDNRALFMPPFSSFASGANDTAVRPTNIISNLYLWADSNDQNGVTFGHRRGTGDNDTSARFLLLNHVFLHSGWDAIYAAARDSNVTYNIYNSQLESHYDTVTFYGSQYATGNIFDSNVFGDRNVPGGRTTALIIFAATGTTINAIDCNLSTQHTSGGSLIADAETIMNQGTGTVRLGRCKISASATETTGIKRGYGVYNKNTGANTYLNSCTVGACETYDLYRISGLLQVDAATTYDVNSGTITKDANTVAIVKDANHVYVSNACTYTRSVDGKALSFNGTSDYIDTGTTLSDGLFDGSWTFVVLAKPDNILGKQTFIGVYDVTQENDALIELSTTDDGKIRLRYIWDETGEQLITDSIVMTANEWQMIVGVVERISIAGDTDNANIRLYRNGVSVGEALGYGNELLISDTPFFSTVTFKIGGWKVPWESGEHNEQYFSGLLDDVRIYNRALTANQVAQLYLEGQGITGYAEPNDVRYGTVYKVEDVNLTGQLVIPGASDVRYGVKFDDSNSLTGNYKGKRRMGIN